jgi:hypothetical protein
MQKNKYYNNQLSTYIDSGYVEVDLFLFKEVKVDQQNEKIF